MHVTIFISRTNPNVYNAKKKTKLSVAAYDNKPNHMGIGKVLSKVDYSFRPLEGSVGVLLLATEKFSPRLYRIIS